MNSQFKKRKAEIVSLSYYQKLILECVEHCQPDETSEVEEIMRDTVLHTTALDWLDRAEFKKVAIEAYEIYKTIEVLKPFAELQGKEYWQLTDAEMDKAIKLSNLKF